MKTTIIAQTTRSNARKAVTTFKSQGIDAKVIDNGSHLSGVERWAVQYKTIATVDTVATPLKRRQTLSISRKPSGDTLQGKKVQTCSKPRTSFKNNDWFKDTKYSNVPVYSKQSKRADSVVISV